MVLSHDDADDVLQNVFLKAWQGIGHFRGDARLSTWLYRIAYNETLNFLDKRNLSTVSLSAGADSDAEAVKVQLESDPYFDGDELQIQLQQAIHSLPPKQLRQ